jgi:pseudouridine-5'-phosphate glycosidase
MHQMSKKVAEMMTTGEIVIMEEKERMTVVTMEAVVSRNLSRNQNLEMAAKVEETNQHRSYDKKHFDSFLLQALIQ